MSEAFIEFDQADPLSGKSLGEKLEVIIDQLPPTQTTLHDILKVIGGDSLMFLAIFLSLVFLVPVSIPGVSTVFGSAILLIGIARLMNRRLWLPERITRRPICSGKLSQVLNRALTWFRHLERISRPHRLPQLISDSKARQFNALAFILAALLLMVPFGFIPFSNTLPAIALIFLAVGVMQKDGGSILLGHLSNGVTIAYFSLLLLGGGRAIQELVQSFLG